MYILPIYKPHFTFQLTDDDIGKWSPNSYQYYVDTRFVQKYPENNKNMRKVLI